MVISILALRSENLFNHLTFLPTKSSFPLPSICPTQDDLMASLEMMNSLAADLPMASSPFRRSYTLNPKRIQRSAGREVTRKPPLPKLAGMPLSPTSPTSPLHHTVPRQASHSPATEHHPLRSPALSRANRPTDLPSKLMSAFEGLCASPGARRKAESQGSSLMIEEEYSPLPGRRGLRTPASPQREDDTLSLSSQLSSYSHSPRAGSEDLDMQCSVAVSSPMFVRRNIRASSSPPTDSGRATSSQGHRNDDSLSVLSCSLSEASDASGSKYDNVRSDATAVENQKGTEHTKEEDALSGTSDILDNLGEDSSSSECGQYECNEQELTSPAKLDNQPQVCLRSNRDSGPYENVKPGGQEIIVNSKQATACRLPDSLVDFVMVDGGEEGVVRNNRTGLHSLRTILTKGQTSNV